jgi:hypothetical protein
MSESPYRSKARIIQADESILDTAWTAHTLRHGCGQNRECAARHVLQEARDKLRSILEDEC